ncbi:hypothetical protein [Enterovibrio coralii]|uniref:hypothetical protein n=1 Tax=Enterovibrio coralii TaxID=294935 RepID=UPI001E528149|nr:hypothetical protein [Enterovibrio coralii]
MKFIKHLVMVFSLFCITVTPSLANSQIPVGMNTSTTLSQPVTHADSKATMPFNIDDADALTVEVIVPVEDATVHLVKPNGQIATSSSDIQANIVSGATQTPPLPGSYVFLPEVKTRIQVSGQSLLNSKALATTLSSWHKSPFNLRLLLAWRLPPTNLWWVNLFPSRHY